MPGIAERCQNLNIPKHVQAIPITSQQFQNIPKFQQIPKVSVGPSMCQYVSVHLISNYAMTYVDISRYMQTYANTVKIYHVSKYFEIFWNILTYQVLLGTRSLQVCAQARCRVPRDTQPEELVEEQAPPWRNSLTDEVEENTNERPKPKQVKKCKNIQSRSTSKHFKTKTSKALQLQNLFRAVCSLCCFIYLYFVSLHIS